jgi:long-chain acyl-CoA synthetase
MINIAANLARNAALISNKVAIHFGDRQFTYAQLDAAASQVANGLAKLEIGKRDKVLLACPSVHYFPIAYCGILKLSAVAVPIASC